jgi:hypothetical protein
LKEIFGFSFRRPPQWKKIWVSGGDGKASSDRVCRNVVGDGVAADQKTEAAHEVVFSGGEGNGEETSVLKMICYQ